MQSIKIWSEQIVKRLFRNRHRKKILLSRIKCTAWWSATRIRRSLPWSAMPSFNLISKLEKSKMCLSVVRTAPRISRSSLSPKMECSTPPEVLSTFSIFFYSLNKIKCVWFKFTIILSIKFIIFLYKWLKGADNTVVLWDNKLNPIKKFSLGSPIQSLSINPVTNVLFAVAN